MNLNGEIIKKIPTPYDASDADWVKKNEIITQEILPKNDSPIDGESLYLLNRG